MVRVSLRLIMFVAGDARENCKIGGVGVAITASRPLAGMAPAVNRKPGVIERRARPTRCGVACVTRSRKLGRHVIGIGGALEVAFVATVAVSGRTSENVIHMAGVASQVYMCAGQREARN